MKNIVKITSILCLLVGCEDNPARIDSKEEIKIEISENRVSHLFPMDSNFEISGQSGQIESLLKEAKSDGSENISFMIISNEPIPEDRRGQVSKQVISQMKRAGFIDSRIVDSGVCVYKDAQRGLRIDVLKYDLKKPDLAWDHSVGDCDVYKNLPRKGASNLWNLEEMVANKADLISPRKYKGQRTEDAVNALSEVNNSSSGGSSSSGSSSSSSSGSSGSSSSSSSSSK